MNSKRDIFFDNRIYIGCEERHLPLFKGSVHLLRLTNYPVQGNHSFSDGENVTGRYELMEHWNSTHTNYTYVAVALPTPPVPDDWFERPAAKDIKKQILKEIEAVPGDGAEAKAKELVEKFKSVEIEDKNGKLHPMLESEAKQCALIHVDGILEQYEYISIYLSPEWCNKQIQFFQQVRQHIVAM